MTELLQQARQEMHRALHVEPPGDEPEAPGWLTAEHVGELLDFYFAQWEHLSALSNQMRWMRPRPARPYEERITELHHLHQTFLRLAPPAWVRRGLDAALDRTLQLAVDRMACDPRLPVHETLLARVRRQQDDLDEAIHAMHKYEAQLTGPAPAIPASALPTVS